VLLGATAAALRVGGLARVRRVLALWSNRAPRRSKALETQAAAIAAATIVSDVAATARLLRARCLTRSLVLEAMLRRAGIDAELKVGARREGQRWRAHAWVEWQGQPLAEPAGIASTFAALEPHSTSLR
jgi:hypothetical protein